MKKIRFETLIDAPRKKVWKVLWDDETYRIWTSVFSEESYVETDWKEGNEILFLDGKGNGMYSIIEKNRPFELMSFKHLGDLKDKQEGKDSQQWSGSIESYILTESGGFTKLTVEMDVEEEYLGFFEQKFPEALEKIKMLAEK